LAEIEIPRVLKEEATVAARHPDATARGDARGRRWKRPFGKAGTDEPVEKDPG
jgi:hypothetical protein